ncbi:2-C-methyl-D-erythritol 2,4-cyclodiphosphate synthase [Candidatus Solincola tengchongensis]|uniref:2-C-methyl-D-erythritol 2,4-cyclodiphosphate synthase n=1 Tax=Candidatus Solincola tengchongensis TaxID=2900693 RepID=UPI002580E69B|nr:2-C-methyl-D-erythritol 2,4-cyclodiphosphate synthase [Candidatus Solincola tengchongensis]
MSCRVGLGFDAHPFVEGRRLVLGGVEIPHERGLAGHSDADVLVHALMDALLGACGERDIGVRFPDTDPTFRGISSMVLLEEVMGVVLERGFRVLNVDCVVAAQEPRISPYVEEMRKRLAFILRVPESRVGIKATTTEGMGFTGRGEGIAAMAVALVEERTEP